MFYTNSASISIDITCNTGYLISEAANTTLQWNGNANFLPSSTQYLTHGPSTTGFVLSIYSSAQQAGCPINLWEISSNNNSVSAVSGLPAIATGQPGSMVVLPDDKSLH
jgi:hypothetical protein